MTSSNHADRKAGTVTDIADARRQRESKPAEDHAETATSADSRKLRSKSANFNHDKVAAIKAAIANGTYQINSQRIADKFIERESP